MATSLDFVLNRASAHGTITSHNESQHQRLHRSKRQSVSSYYCRRPTAITIQQGGLIELAKGLLSPFLPMVYRVAQKLNPREKYAK